MPSPRPSKNIPKGKTLPLVTGRPSLSAGYMQGCPRDSVDVDDDDKDDDDMGKEAFAVDQATYWPGTARSRPFNGRTRMATCTLSTGLGVVAAADADMRGLFFW